MRGNRVVGVVCGVAGAILLLLRVYGFDHGRLAFAQAGPVCGDGIVFPQTEQCDEGSANGTPGSCCLAACTLRPPGQACRASQGVCDVAETCDGQRGACPADAFLPSGTPCRASRGVCDIEETCDGKTGACPADAFLEPGTPCTLEDPCTTQDHCDLGTCTGTRICDADATQGPKECLTHCDSRTQTRPVITVMCDVMRSLLPGATRGGRCITTTFQHASPATASRAADVGGELTCTTMPAGGEDCATAHQGLLQMTRKQRRKLRKNGSAVVQMKLNSLARGLLENAGSPVQADVCGTMRLQGEEINFECSLEVVAPAP
jgi:hypothetical protein